MTDLISRADAIAKLADARAAYFDSTGFSRGAWYGFAVASDIIAKLPAQPMPAPDVSGVIEKLDRADYLCGKDNWETKELLAEVIEAMKKQLATAGDVAKLVSLIDCAMALQGNERIKLGADLQAIAKAVLDAAGVPYED